MSGAIRPGPVRPRYYVTRVRKGTHVAERYMVRDRSMRAAVGWFLDLDEARRACDDANASSVGTSLIDYADTETRAVRPDEKE